MKSTFRAIRLTQNVLSPNNSADSTRKSITLTEHRMIKIMPQRKQPKLFKNKNDMGMSTVKNQST